METLEQYAERVHLDAEEMEIQRAFENNELVRSKDFEKRKSLFSAMAKRTLADISAKRAVTVITTARPAPSRSVKWGSSVPLRAVAMAGSKVK